MGQVRGALALGAELVAIGGKALLAGGAAGVGLVHRVGPSVLVTTYSRAPLQHGFCSALKFHLNCTNEGLLCIFTCWAFVYGGGQMV